ncbi:Rv1733c family protein [Nocardia pseudovaccinii]|uniref:Rv1733c family protein n=1 Tax=Nocardia pseudovaccinii TaxID=189540 RepID=UPI003D8AB5E2
MSEYPSVSTRLWRRRPWRTSSLMRASDRVEALVWLFAIIVMLVAVPVAGAAGTAGYTAAASRIRVENATKVAVPATITTKPERIVTVDAYGSTTERFDATVRWDQNGRSGTTTTEVPDKSATGDEVRVWLDRGGNVTTPPVRAINAASSGIGIGLTILVTVWSCAVLLGYGTGGLLRAGRYAALDREWRGMSRPVGQDS